MLDGQWVIAKDGPPLGSERPQLVHGRRTIFRPAAGPPGLGVQPELRGTCILLDTAGSPEAVFRGTGFYRDRDGLWPAGHGTMTYLKRGRADHVCRGRFHRRMPSQIIPEPTFPSTGVLRRMR